MLLKYILISYSGTKYSTAYNSFIKFVLNCICIQQNTHTLNSMMRTEVPCAYPERWHNEQKKKKSMHTLNQLYYHFIGTTGAWRTKEHHCSTSWLASQWWYGPPPGHRWSFSHRFEFQKHLMHFKSFWFIHLCWSTFGCLRLNRTNCSFPNYSAQTEEQVEFYPECLNHYLKLISESFKWSEGDSVSLFCPV